MHTPMCFPERISWLLYCKKKKLLGKHKLQIIFTTLQQQNTEYLGLENPELNNVLNVFSLTHFYNAHSTTLKYTHVF